MRNNSKILMIAVIVLLISNIALVAFMLTGKKKGERKRPGGMEPSEMLIKELGMTGQQQKDFKRLKEEHFKNVRPLFDSIRAAKTAFFALIKESSVSDSTLDLHSRNISTRQAELDKLTFAHFRRVRNLFTAEQQPRYDSFITKMMKRGRRDSADRKK